MVVAVEVLDVVVVVAAVVEVVVVVVEVAAFPQPAITNDKTNRITSGIKYFFMTTNPPRLIRVILPSTNNQDRLDSCACQVRLPEFNLTSTGTVASRWNHHAEGQLSNSYAPGRLILL